MQHAGIRRSWKFAIGLGLSTEILWALAQPILPRGVLQGSVVLMFMNGWVAAIASSIICFSVPSTRFQHAGIMAGALGFSHPLWCFATVLMLAAAGVRSDGLLADTPKFIVTGIGFLVPILIASRSLRIGGLMLVATTLSALIAMTVPIDIGSLRGMGLACATLHLGIGSCFALAAWRALQRQPGPPTCEHCGYSLVGLPALSPCPECGSTTPISPR